jgi:hypothetical protein
MQKNRFFGKLKVVGSYTFTIRLIAQKVLFVRMKSQLTVLFIAFGACGFSIGCASQEEWRLSTEPVVAESKARAHPAAYGVSDAFTFGKPHRVRPANDFLFYFKECGLTDPRGDRAYFSKTAYACTGPR